MSKHCDKQSPAIPETGGGYFFCQLPAGHDGKHRSESQHTTFEDPAWIVSPNSAQMNYYYPIESQEYARLQRENAALKKVVEAIRGMFAFGPEWRVAPIKKALAELDAGEGR